MSKYVLDIFKLYSKSQNRQKGIGWGKIKMMEFEFKINKYYLAGYAMISKNKPFPAWKRLEEIIWKKYKNEPAYYFLNPKYISWALEKMQTGFLDKNIKEIFLKHAATLKKIYQEIFKTKEFKRLLKETETYLVSVRNQWNKNKIEALKILQDISKLSLPKHKITVYITHPKSHNGKTIDKNTIAWGHQEDWENYSVVYLCHELLHIMTWPGHFQPRFDILQNLISLTAENELRIRLNKRGKYFKEGKNYVVLPETIPEQKKILPYWKKYLSGELGKNILELKDFLVKLKKLKKLK